MFSIVFGIIIVILHFKSSNDRTKAIFKYLLLVFLMISILLSGSYSFFQKDLKFAQSTSNQAVTVLGKVEKLRYNFPYFSKLFKKHMGCNLSEYINLTKLDVASKMLSNTDKRIENIGYEVGFNNKSYFYRVFKRYYGVTPEEYRKSGRKR